MAADREWDRSAGKATDRRSHLVTSTPAHEPTDRAATSRSAGATDLITRCWRSPLAVVGPDTVFQPSGNPIRARREV